MPHQFRIFGNGREKLLINADAEPAARNQVFCYFFFFCFQSCQIKRRVRIQDPVCVKALTAGKNLGVLQAAKPPEEQYHFLLLAFL